jgi:hypothetical protein
MNYKAKVVPNDFSSSGMELTHLEEKRHFQKVHPLKKSELWAWVCMQTDSWHVKVLLK